MSRSLAITADQQDAVGRHSLEGVVYLLSGTLTGRDSVPDATFYWATRDVTAFGQDFKAYLGPPRAYSRSVGFEPGAQGVMQEVRVPIRNLPFAHAESMVAAVADDDFRWENTTATLRVGYLKPGQTPADLADADWTAVLLDGVLGPPDEVTLDGFILPVLPRGARRNQNLFWPQLPSVDTISGGAIDRKDAARMPPVFIGSPQDWIRVPSINLGVRGFCVSGYAAGSTVLKFAPITVGPERFTSGNLPVADVDFEGGGAYGTGTGQAGIMVHYMGPVYEVSGASFDPVTNEFTVTLASGLAADAPRGAFVQQYGPAFNPDTKRVLGATQTGQANGLTSYWWVLGNRVKEPLSGGITAARFGWLLGDGEVRPAEDGEWPFAFAANPQSLDLKREGGRNLGGAGGGAGQEPQEGAVIVVRRGTRQSPKAPVYYDPGVAGTDVAQQPAFGTTAKERLTSKINYPTGGTGADNANARDGNETTSMGLAASEVKTLTFNSAPAPFADDDTTASTLHVIAGNGATTFTDSTGSTTFGSVAAAGVYRFTQVAARDFNETVRCVGGGSGGNVIEVWWEHDAAADITLNRTQDVKLVSSTVALGPVMQYAELVVQMGPASSRTHTVVPSGAVVLGQSFATPSMVSSETFSGFDSQVPYPTNAMLGLHMLLGTSEGTINAIDIPSYEVAHARFVEKNLRVNLVWTEETRPSSWTDLERRMGEQTRSFMYYGPSGHQILFMEDASGTEALPVQQSFRLPGTPGANTLGAGAPLMERTRTTELVNQVDVLWEPDGLTGEHTRVVSAQNDESLADVGIRTRGQPHRFDLMSWDGNPAYAVAESVSGIAQFYADRQAFSATRFNFESAWVAHGLDRGSIIRVAYPVSTSPPSYRNVTAEVETIEPSPLNAERVRLRARSVSKPQKGLDPAFIWTDVFTEESDAWTTRLLQEFDTWADYWSVK